MIRLRSGPEDFAELGLSERVEPWEDGRRTPLSADYFEWWYLDSVLNDGTIVVAWFGDNWTYGTRSRAVNLEITRPGERTRRTHWKFAEPGTFATDRCEVRIGPHALTEDHGSYRLRIDPTDGLGCDLKLAPALAPFRPGTGLIAAGDSFFAWLVPVPGGTVSGTLTIDGKVREVAGHGYHDHNWGNAAPSRLFRRWWWAHGADGERSVIAMVYQAREQLGGASIPVLYVGGTRDTETDALDAEVRFSEGAPTPHPDRSRTRPIASSVVWSAGGVTLAASPRKMLASFDLRRRPAMLTSEGISDSLPWYSRFTGDLTLTLADGSVATGSGVVECFEFE